MSLRQKFDIATMVMLITMSWVFFYASIKYSSTSVAVIYACSARFFSSVFEPLINKKKFCISAFY